MAFREVGVIEVMEILRLWGAGLGTRRIAARLSVDRKTVRRYVDAAERRGLKRSGGVELVSEALAGEIVRSIQKASTGERGDAWKICQQNRERLAAWVEKKLTLTKVRELLLRTTGQQVPYRTLHRFAVCELSFGKPRVTVRVEDGEPGEELQVDFGRLGLMWDEPSARRRTLWALIFTACYSRHQFVFPTFTQTIPDVIEGFERAWEFFGGIFKVVIPDNLKAVVTKADAIAPRFSETFLEYAQARGFLIDPARVRHPRDKGRVERQVTYVRDSFFGGEEFRDLPDVRRRAEAWSRTVAALRVHGTTQRRPLEVFEAEEKGRLLPAPQAPYDVPLHADVLVSKDHHVRVDKALYSVPTSWIGQRVHVRADGTLVKITQAGALIKTHPRQRPGGRSTDPDDYPPEKALYATRNQAALLLKARSSGEAVGAFADKLLCGPLPWSRMRQVYRLLSLVRVYGEGRVRKACQKALEADVVDVVRLSRMLERGLEDPGRSPSAPTRSNVIPFRFQRPREHFALQARQAVDPGIAQEKDDEHRDDLS